MVKRIVGGVLFVVVLGVLVSLGVWQLQRLAWKQDVLATIEDRIAAAPRDLPAAPDPEADRYLPVAVAGRFEEGELHVLVSSRDYGAGFRIIAPFVTDSGRRIMIDRGFVMTEAKEAERPLGAASVTGNLHWPDERNGSTPDDDPDGNWWYARDVEKMAGALDTEPLLVIARSETGAGILPMPVTSLGIPNNHLSYAIQWFSFAVIWVVMTGFALWRIRRRNT